MRSTDSCQDSCVNRSKFALNREHFTDFVLTSTNCCLAQPLVLSHAVANLTHAIVQGRIVLKALKVSIPDTTPMQVETLVMDIQQIKLDTIGASRGQGHSAWCQHGVLTVVQASLRVMTSGCLKPSQTAPQGYAIRNPIA